MPSDAGTLVTTGIALGVLHVLTGPDHLSAICTLSASVSSCRTSFGLGVRWGVGHSIGLLLVGIILIAILDASSGTLEVPEPVSRSFEALVGVFMILLGFYGLALAQRKRRDANNSSAQDIAVHERTSIEPNSVSEVDVDDDPEDALVVKVPADDDMPGSGRPQPSVDAELNQCGPVVEAHAHEHFACCLFFTSKLSTTSMALLMGIVHGFAGPGGVLGVIPAVQIRDAKLATLYLGTFCITSTFTMGCFASLFGVMTRWVGVKSGWEFKVECTSACLSIVVGITWLVLTAIGKLDVVFP